MPVGLFLQGFVLTPRGQSSEKTNWPNPNFWQRGSAMELRSQNLLLGLYGFPYRRALHHALLPGRISAQLLHGKSAAHAPAVENQRIRIDKRILTAHDPAFSLEHGVPGNWPRTIAFLFP